MSLAVAVSMSIPSGILALPEFDFRLGETDVDRRHVAVTVGLPARGDLHRPPRAADGDVRVLHELAHRQDERRVAGQLLPLAFRGQARRDDLPMPFKERSEEHTSELQSLRHLVCRLLLEKKKNIKDEQPTKIDDRLI